MGHRADGRVAIHTSQARELLLAAADTDTAYGRVLDVGQSLGHRNTGVEPCATRSATAGSARQDELAGDDVAAAELSAAREHGDFDVAYLYAGQGVELLRAE